MKKYFEDCDHLDEFLNKQLDPNKEANCFVDDGSFDPHRPGGSTAQLESLFRKLCQSCSSAAMARREVSGVLCGVDGLLGLLESMLVLVWMLMQVAVVVVVVVALVVLVLVVVVVVVVVVIMVVVVVMVVVVIVLRTPLFLLLSVVSAVARRILPSAIRTGCPHDGIA